MFSLKKIFLFSIIFIFTITLLGILLVPLYSYLGPDAEFPEYVSANDARNYVGFQILQAVLFAVMAFMIAIAITKNTALGMVIGVAEILGQASTAQSFSGNATPLMMGAIAYVMLFVPVVILGRWIETRFSWSRM